MGKGSRQPARDVPVRLCDNLGSQRLDQTGSPHTRTFPGPGSPTSELSLLCGLKVPGGQGWGMAEPLGQ